MVEGWREFLNTYSLPDESHVYTKGEQLIQCSMVEQMVHLYCSDKAVRVSEAAARMCDAFVKYVQDELTCYDDDGCCSVCENRIGQITYGDGIRTEPKYCPHCGSRIRRKK